MADNPYATPIPTGDTSSGSDVDNPNVKAFRDIISQSEGADYNTLVGGTKFDDLSKHPNKVGLVTKAGSSTAAGRYQITNQTNKEMAAKLGIKDFSPESQDRIATELMKRNGALDDIKKGDFDTAKEKLKKTWTSFDKPASKTNPYAIPIPKSTSNPYADPIPKENPYASAIVKGPSTTQNPLVTGATHTIAGLPGAMGGTAAATALTAMAEPAFVAAAPFTGGASLIAGPILTTLVGYGVGSWGASKAEHALLPNRVNEYLEKGEKDNPYSAFGGELLSFGGVNGIATPTKMKKAAILAAGGFGFEGLNQAISGDWDAMKLGISTVAMPFFGGSPTALGKISTLAKLRIASKENASDLIKRDTYIPKNVKGTNVIDVSKESETAYRERHDHYDEATSTKTGPDAGGVSRTIISSGTFSDSTGTHTASYSSRDDGGLERTITYEGESPKRESYLELEDGSNIWHDVNKSMPKGAKPATYSEKIAKDITKDDITGYTERGAPGSVAEHISTRTEDLSPIRTHVDKNGTVHIEVDSTKLDEHVANGEADKQFGLPPNTLKSPQDYVDFALHRHSVQQEVSFNQWKDAHPNYDIEEQYSARKDFYDEKDKLTSEVIDKHSAGEDASAAEAALKEHNAKGAPPPAVEDKSNLTPKELHSVLYGANTVGQALDRIVAGGFGGKRTQALAKVLQGNKYMAASTLILDETPHPKEFGSYDGAMHEVTLRGEATTNTFVHESLHAGTSNALADPANKEVADKFDALLKELKAGSTEAEIYDDELNLGIYGLKDVHELISEAFSNPKLQNWLKDRSVTLDKAPTSAWGGFKALVKDALGIKGKEGHSALDQVLDLTHELLHKEDHYSRWDRKGTLDKFDTNEGSYQNYLNQSAKELSDTNPFFNVDSLNIPGIPHDQQGLADFLYVLDHGGSIDDIVNAHAYSDVIKNISKEQLNKMRTFVEGITTEMSAEDKKLFNDTYKPLLAENKAGQAHLMDEGVIPKVELGETHFPRKLLEMSPEKRAQVAAALKEAGVEDHDTLFGKFKNYMKELGGGDMGGFNADMERRRNSTQERSLFQLEHSDGSRRVIQVTKSGSIIEWKDGKAKFIGNKHNPDGSRVTESGNVKVGDRIEGGKVIEGAMDDIEKHSPYRYNKDSLAVLLNANKEIREQLRMHEGLKNLREGDLFKTMSSAPGEAIPEDWRVPKFIDKIPALRGYAFPQKMAEVLEDFAKINDPSMLTSFSNAIIKCMMLNPIAHIFNEGMHLYNARGLSGWVTPGGIARFAKYGSEAMNSVLQQDEFYRDTIKLGGSLLSPNVRHSALEEAIHNKGVTEFGKTLEFKQLALSLGRKPGELLNAISAKSATAMWVTRDMMYMQYLKELMSTKELSHQEAIQHAEKHMPNYRLPTRVGEGIMGAKFGRGLSNVLQNPNISVFSRYHYGMVKSMVETAKDVGAIRKGKAGLTQFKEGVDTSAAIAVALSVLYPLMDKMAVALTGNEDAKQRRAGPYHLINAVMEVAEGTKDPQAILSSIFTFNPALQGLVEIGLDRKAYSGQQVYNPQSSPDVIAKDIGLYIAQQNPLLGQGMKAEEDKAGPDEGWATALARQADIIAPSGIKAGKDLQRENKLNKKGMIHTIKSREGLE